jgi:hypothetical protein
VVLRGLELRARHAVVVEPILWFENQAAQLIRLEPVSAHRMKKSGKRNFGYQRQPANFGGRARLMAARDFLSVRKGRVVRLNSPETGNLLASGSAWWCTQSDHNPSQGRFLVTGNFTGIFPVSTLRPTLESPRMPNFLGVSCAYRSNRNRDFRAEKQGNCNTRPRLSQLEFAIKQCFIVRCEPHKRAASRSEARSPRSAELKAKSRCRGGVTSLQSDKPLPILPPVAQARGDAVDGQMERTRHGMSTGAVFPRQRGEKISGPSSSGSNGSFALRRTRANAHHRHRDLPYRSRQ